MPSVEPGAAEIGEVLARFEASVAGAERALMAREWEQVDALLSEQHRLTHALANLLDATADRSAELDADVDRRLAQIVGARADQLRRLVAFNELVKQRLTIVARTKEMRRVNVASEEPARLLNLLQ